ncbi:hypothetical protein CQW23_26434 [Capsicum baccatum]|uniref:Uncharacterized protein n=1 Tax=Capsicum baccatum TaxID=33114 RepID=A0A2G2VNT3_CAPBA|nr:hypothetical protein CQW23_26434 [Capsicum baccatum]
MQEVVRTCDEEVHECPSTEVREAMFLKTEVEGSKIIKNEARNVLLELAKDEYNKILIMEEGLLLIPLVGAAAYKSFRPALYSLPPLPDGTKIEQNPRPSRYGASELLLGLNIDYSNAKIEEKTMKAMVGRTRQQFLARIGAIETEEENKSSGEFPSNPRFTLLPWMDGVARLVLILGLEDESAIARAAGAIADLSINEHIRGSFKEAGAINPLVRLINHPSDNVKLAVIRAIQRLSISNELCQRLQAENALYSLIYLLCNSDISSSLTRMILDILTRILDPSKEMKSKKAQSAARNAGLTGNENVKVASTTSSTVLFDEPTIFIWKLLVLMIQSNHLLHSHALHFGYLMLKSGRGEMLRLIELGRKGE